MAQVMTTAKAGANWFSAVPPMVWSAFRLMAAKPSSSEKIMPVTPAFAVVMTWAIQGQGLTTIFIPNWVRCV